MAVVDASVEELAASQDRALERFGLLLEGVDASLPVPGATWTVRDVVAHLAGTAARYASADPALMAAMPRGVDSLNDADLRALEGLSIAELFSALRDGHRALKTAAERRSADDRVAFHAGLSLSPIAAGGEWLGELLLHGLDVARARRHRWSIRPRDALLISVFAFEVLPGYVDISRIRPPLRATVALLGGRPQTITIEEGTVSVEDRRGAFPAHVRFLSTPGAWILNGYGRVTLVGAIRKGLLVIGGRQPWRALELQRALVRP